MRQVIETDLLGLDPETFDNDTALIRAVIEDFGGEVLGSCRLEGTIECEVSEEATRRLALLPHVVHTGPPRKISRD